MTTYLHRATVSTWARAAGLGYMGIIAAGLYAEFFVRGSLIVPGDASATSMNITGSDFLFRTAFASDLMMLVADVMVSSALFIVFRSVDESLALLAAFLRLTHSAIVGMNVLAGYVALELLSGGTYLEPVGSAARASLALLLLEGHAYGYAIGLVFFGACCAVLGRLIIRSELVPRPLGFLLLLAAAGYLTDSLARTLIGRYEAYQDTFGLIVLLPALVAELSFGLWLLVKGVDATTLRPLPRVEHGPANVDGKRIDE